MLFKIGCEFPVGIFSLEVSARVREGCVFILSVVYRQSGLLDRLITSGLILFVVIDRSCQLTNALKVLILVYIFEKFSLIYFWNRF